jgi:site-specific recombinase XerD
LPGSIQEPSNPPRSGTNRERSDACPETEHDSPAPTARQTRLEFQKHGPVASIARSIHIRDLRHSLASALANSGTPLDEIGAVLGRRQLSTTTRYAHHSPQRMVETATVAERTRNLLPGPEAVED